MSALDEYTEGKLEKHELQNAIFDHYMKMSSSLVAENINGSKRLFIWKIQRGKQNARERKTFRNFMNEEVKTKKKCKRSKCFNIQNLNLKEY